jgi:hypothetical protein
MGFGFDLLFKVTEVTKKSCKLGILTMSNRFWCGDVLDQYSMPSSMLVFDLTYFSRSEVRIEKVVHT